MVDRKKGGQFQIILVSREGRPNPCLGSVSCLRPPSSVLRCGSDIPLQRYCRSAAREWKNGCMYSSILDSPCPFQLLHTHMNH